MVAGEGGQSTSGQESERMTVLLYSDNSQVREQVRLAVGRRPAADLPRVEFLECATEPVVLRRLAEEYVDVAILDGEAQPAGGMGVCRQAKDEIFQCPPILVLIARRDDGWLATWSRADAVAAHSVDPVELPAALAGLMRQRGNPVPTQHS